MRLLKTGPTKVLCLVLWVAALVALSSTSAIAQAERSPTDLALIASYTASELETVVEGIRSKAPAASQSDEDTRSKRIAMLESASSLLSGIAYEASRGATASETRPEMIEAARLLHHAYLTAQEAGDYPATSDLVAVEKLIRDLDAHYNPKATDEESLRGSP